jgi:hypothetical protein
MAIFQQQSRHPVQVLGLESVHRKKGGTVMKRFVWAMVLVISILGWRELLAQSKPARVMAEFTGASLKWIHAAEPEFQREKLDLDKYLVSIVEQSDSVMVGLRSFDSVQRDEGQHGKLPGIRG